MQETSPDHATWEAVTRRRVLAPLGMVRTNFSVHDSERDADHARPYRQRDDAAAPAPPPTRATASAPPPPRAKPRPPRRPSKPCPWKT